ncbi:MAG TPA: hypothetical protein VGQ16_11845 [Vicinamibacterales bacterium]|jgi:hypothetical protein|nr:hypothetical protein [Vicinamibacterales bacterium]
MTSWLRALIAFTYVIVAAPASALDLVIRDIHTPASTVTANIEVRDVLPDRFRKMLDDGGMLHLRVEAELWESRPVWDRLVYPAIVRMFRLGRAGSGREISVSDSGGSTRTYPTPPHPLPVMIELGSSTRITASARYYVHVMATLGTLAEKDADEVGDAVFGRESESNGLGSLGRRVFRTVIKLNDYLQSVSAETTTKKTPGSDILRR